MFGIPAIPLMWKVGIGAAIVLGAAAYGYDKGGERVQSKWDAAESKAAADALYDYMRTQADIDSKVTLARANTDQRIADATTRATKLQGELNAIRTRKPLPPACVLDDERVQWANRTLGYTAADGALR